MSTLKIKDPDAPLKVEAAQVPPALHGNHSMTPRQIDLTSNINPATGAPYVQVGPRPLGGQISPPPSRNFK